MDIQQFLLILQARYKVVVFVLVTTILVALAASLLMQNKYTATVSVLLDTKSPDPLLGMLATPINYMPTQVDIISSDRVARKVVHVLKLDENMAVRQQWQDESKGAEPLVEWLGKLLGKGLIVKPAQESNVINITYTATEPGFAALAANAFAQAYIDTNIELKVEPARQYAAWFQERAKELRSDLEKAQSRLADYQQRTGVVVSDARQPTDEHSKIYELSKQLSQAEAETVDARSKQMHTGSTESMPDVMKSPVIQSIKEKIITQEAKLEELGRLLGKNHPQYQATQDQIMALKRKMDEESRQIMNSISTANRVNKQKEEELKASIESHKKLAIEDMEQLDQIAVLQREVESAQKAYDVVVQRFTDSSLQSQSNQTNISVLNPATAPTERSSPMILKNILKAIVIGLVLGLGIMVLWEMIDQRVRSLVMLGTATGVPVLVHLSQNSGPVSTKDRLLKFFRMFALKAKMNKTPAVV